MKHRELTEKEVNKLLGEDVCLECGGDAYIVPDGADFEVTCHKCKGTGKASKPEQEKIVEAFEEALRRYNPDDLIEDYFFDAGYKSASSRIAELEKEVERLKNEWISVDDRLPPLDTVFDAWDNYHNKRVANVGAYTGSWDDDFRKDCMLIKGRTHWMPLPKGPK